MLLLNEFKYCVFILIYGPLLFYKNYLKGTYLASLGSNEESTPPKRVGLPITLEAIPGMPTHGIEPQTRIYKIRVIPFNYAGWLY